jgi:hypothetical protein
LNLALAVSRESGILISALAKACPGGSLSMPAAGFTGERTTAVAALASRSVLLSRMG